MSSYERALWLEEVFGPPETREPGPSDENQRNVMLPTREQQPETHTYDEWRELKIRDGLCPMPGCSGSLDLDFFCSGCGNVSLPTVGAGSVSPSGLSGEPGQPELPLDEYSPAQVEAA